jgi:hypothetical protein
LKDVKQKKEIQDLKYIGALNNAIATATNHYRNAMEIDMSSLNDLSPSQLNDLHKNHSAYARKTIESLTEQYPTEVWKPYVKQANLVRFCHKS